MNLDKLIGVVVLIAILALCIFWASFTVVPRIKALVDKNPKFAESILSGICEFKELDEARVDFIWRRENDDRTVNDLMREVAKICFTGQDAFKIEFNQIVSENCTYENDDFTKLMEEGSEKQPKEDGLIIYVNSSPGDYPPHVVPGHSYTLRAVRVGRKEEYFKCMTHDMISKDEKLEGGCGTANPDSPPELGSYSENGIFVNPDIAAEKCDEALETRTWPPCAGYECKEEKDGGKYYHRIEEIDGHSRDKLPDFCVYLTGGEVI